MKTPITADMNLNDTTLLNTNHNSNFFNQSTFTSPSNPILRSSNGANYTLDSLETRGVNALHRRAEQLKRWQEAEEEYEIKKQQKQLDSRNHANLINKANLIFKKRNDDSRKIKFSNSTLFLAACASSDYDEINRLLNNNLVDINVGNVDGLTALHHACIDDNLELVEFLLKRGADVNAVDNEGWSALHATASCDHIEIARLLLLYGADCTLANVDHELALDLAEDDEMQKLLEDALYEQEKVTDFDKLRRQEETRMREDVLEMIRIGIYDPKIHKRTGATIIHVAACKGYLEVLQLLFENKVLKKQIDTNVKDNEGWTPLTAATYWNKPLVVELLLQNGADVNCVTNNNQSLEQMTDYDLILNLIATRREQLKKQENQRIHEENKENGNLNKSNAESETQRKAHAKRIRESRRSTQGISAEDVNKAKDQLLLNSTIINLSGNESKSREQSKTGDTNRVEITKLETINEIGLSLNEESAQIQPSSLPIQLSTLQKTSHNDNCEIVEVKSSLDYTDGQRSKRGFTTPYRPRITVDENDDDVDLKTTIKLNTGTVSNDDKEDELKNDVVINLRRDSLNILHQRKDTRKSTNLNHGNNKDTSVRVDHSNDNQAPKLATSSKPLNNVVINELDEELNNLEQTLDYTVRRNISQDSLDEQTNVNHNDYIGINSTINASQAPNYPIVNKNGLDDTSIITSRRTQPIDDLKYTWNKPYTDRQFVDKLIDRHDFIDKNSDKQSNESIVCSNSNYLPLGKSYNQAPSAKNFEVPVLIETPCTPECTLTNSSFDNDSEQNLSKRKRNKRRIENQDEIDVLFNETVNTINHTINPKYTRNMDTTSYSNENKSNYLFNKPNSISSNNSINTVKSNSSNGNALKLYKKIDEDAKLPNSSVTRSRPSSITTTNTPAQSNYFNKTLEHTDQNINNDKNNSIESPVASSDYKPIKSINQPIVNQQSTIVDPQAIAGSQQAKENKTELDYKKLYEDLIIDFESFKTEVNKKEQDYLREKRKMERKISELEEELKQMESVKEDSTRLKNENGALVRVISKLSK